MTDPNLSEHIERVRSAQLSADAHEEGIEAAARAVHEYIELKGPKTLARPRTMARTAIDAYLEALNAH